jgi:hypothetical protein
MNWNPFKTKEEPELDPLADLVLANLKPGYILDYDLKTWKVDAHHTIDYEGDKADEWVITCADETIYLEREDDDEPTLGISRKIRLSDLDGDIRIHMKNNDDPPEEITHNGITYYADSSSVGQFYENGEGAGQEFIVWDYEDDSEKRTLCIEQWGEDEFEASVGEVVEEYQFSNILPAG